METFFFIIEVLAVLAFAYAGVGEARRSGFDYVGVLTVAIVSAFGGGTLRDILLNRRPLYWVEHWEFLAGIFVLTAAELVLLRFNKDLSSRKTLMVIDALGLGLFCSSGVAIALEAKTPTLPAVLIGVITATFGGVLRDILCDRKPQLFQPTQPIYATCAFIGAWSYVFLHQVAPAFAAIVCILVTLLLRLLAVRLNLRLPF